MLLAMLTKEHRALVVPGLAGLTVGLVGGLIYRHVEACPHGCVETQIAAAFLLPPAVMLVSGIVLGLARASRAWLVSLLGVLGMIIVVVCLSRVTYSYLLISVFAGLVGFLWAAVVLGKMFSNTTRVTALVLLFAIIPATVWLPPVGRARQMVLRLESISVPLLAPRVPGFEVTYATGDRDANVFTLTLAPPNAPEGSMSDEIRITGLAVPANFDPPYSCGPVYHGSKANPPCDPAGTDLWRRVVHDRDTQFVVKHGRWLYVVEGGDRVGAETVQLAATTLHPVTAHHLGLLSWRAYERAIGADGR